MLRVYVSHPYKLRYPEDTLICLGLCCTLVNVEPSWEDRDLAGEELREGERERDNELHSFG